MKKKIIILISFIIILITSIYTIYYIVNSNNKSNKVKDNFSNSIGQYVLYCNKNTSINLDNIKDTNLKLITYEIDGIFDFDKNEYKDILKISYKYTYKYDNKDEYNFKLDSLKKHSIAFINNNEKKLEIYEKHFMYTGSDNYYDFYGNYIEGKFELTYQDVYNYLSNNGYICSEN